MVRVTVVILTYNLEKYIKQAIESVINQNVTFDYQILICDDASTDNTKVIIEDYKKKYPDLIRIILQENNLGSLANSNVAFQNVKTEYFAFLDGDDYWIEKNRLQKQFDFLESHKEYSMCAGNTQYLVDNKFDNTVIPRNLLNRTYSFKDYLEGKSPFVHTSSILYRNEVYKKDIPEVYTIAENTFENCALRGEDFRYILHLEKGPIYLYDENFSVYRIHSKGIWQGSSQVKRNLELLITSNFYRKYFINRYDNVFEKRFVKAYQQFSEFLLEKKISEKYILTESETNLLFKLLEEISRDGSINWEKIPNKKRGLRQKIEETRKIWLS